MAEVNFPQYRNYVASYTDGNNAIMALLAGSLLASHTLYLTEGSKHLLADIYPAVPHIRRFNLRSDMAMALIHDAEAHLAAVALPYALALHEAFVDDSKKMLEDNNVTIVRNGLRWNAENMHNILFTSSNYPHPATDLEIFDLLRRIRNDLIHNGGTVTSYLSDGLAELSIQAAAEWQRISGRSPQDVVIAGKLSLGAGEIFVAFAMTKSLGRSMNEALRHCISMNRWAEIVVADFASEIRNVIRNSDSWMRKLRGYAQHNYGSLELSKGDLEAAARSAGHWTRA